LTSRFKSLKNKVDNLQEAWKMSKEFKNVSKERNNSAIKNPTTKGMKPPVNKPVNTMSAATKPRKKQ
jgi:hypothetical protein